MPLMVGKDMVRLVSPEICGLDMLLKSSLPVEKHYFFKMLLQFCLEGKVQHHHQLFCLVVTLSQCSAETKIRECGQIEESNVTINC